MNWYRTANRQINLPISSNLDFILNRLKTRAKLLLVVGGAVRDAILGVQPKDLDVEIYGIPQEQLEVFIKEISNELQEKLKSEHPEDSSIRVACDFVGKSFGVTKVWVLTKDYKEDFDFSLPRKDSKREDASGHKDFDVEVNENFSVEEACSRRDFTINSIGYDVLNDKIYDPFNGVKDLENKVLRATNDQTFFDDILRPLRGMQFCARLGLTIEPRTAEMCKISFDKAFEYNEEKEEYTVRNNESGLPVLPVERISEEWTKLFLKGKYPGNVIKFLADTGWIRAYPELEKCIGVKQDKRYHEEIFLENHISQILNVSARISDREGLNESDRTVLLLAGLCHDLGKVVTTRTEKDKEGNNKITTKGHPEAGVEFAKNLMNRIGINQKIIDKVLPMVQFHMFHIVGYKQNPLKNNVRQLADKVNPSNIKLLTLLMEADKKARAADNNPIYSAPIHQDVLKIKQDAEEQGVLNGVYKSFFQDKGGVLLSLFPNPKHRIFIGQIQRAVREEMLKGKNSKINTEDEAWDFAKNKAADLVLKDILNAQNDIIEPYHIEGPALGEFLKHLKESYINNQFSTRDQLLELMKMEVKNNMTTHVSSNTILKYSSHNLNYNSDIPCPEEIIVLELKRPEPRWTIIASVIGDENQCSSIKQLYQEDRDFCIETYEEILDELLSGEVSDYLERKASKYSDDFDINLNDPFEDLKKFMGEDIVNGAITLINAVDPKALGSLTYVGILHDSEEIGRFDKEFDNKVKNIYLSKVNPDIEEDAIVDEQKNRKGVSILISPERIEEKALSLSPEDYSEDVESELQKIILAEIVLHELDHAVGFDGENPSNSEQETYVENKNYLKIILNLVNKNRINNSQEPLPVDVKG